MLRRLEGSGIEIGAFQAPQFLPSGDVTYVDLLSREEALAFFPEVPESIPAIDPDILARADNLSSLQDASQDFLIASHLLEHTEDPVGVLMEWRRVLKRGALLYLCLPDKRNTFDASRERTPLQHLLEDHDMCESKELEGRNRGHYLEWARHVNGLEDECQAMLWAEILQAVQFPIHFHCWIPDDILELLQWFSSTEERSFKVVDQEVMRAGYEFAFLLEAG